MRRVVLGTVAGRSRVTHDGVAPGVHRGMAPGYAVTEIWATTAMPPVVDGDDPTPLGLDTTLPAAQTRFWVAEFPPGNGGLPPVRHDTPTLDYLCVLSGSITIELDDGAVTLHAGDTAVQRANMHGWRNDGAVPCRMGVVMVSLAPPA